MRHDNTDRVSMAKLRCAVVKAEDVIVLNGYFTATSYFLRF